MNPSYHLWDLLLYLGESLREQEGSVDVLEMLLESLVSSNKASKSISSREAIMDSSISLESEYVRLCSEVLKFEEMAVLTCPCPCPCPIVQTTARSV